MSELGQYKLPKGWVWSTIPEIVGKNGLFIDGDWVESKDQDPDGDVRLIQLADVGDGAYRDKSNRFMTKSKADELSCTFLKEGDVLIARMPDPLGRACIFPGDEKPAVTVVDVAIARSGKGEFDHRWLACFVNAHPFRSAISGLQAGSTRKRISRGNLATIPLPIPPLPEQRRIVAEIEKQFSRLEEGVSALKRVQANLKRYRAAVLKAACEGKLVDNEVKSQKLKGKSVETGEQLLKRILAERRKNWSGRGKYKEPAALDATNLPQLPEGWTWASIDQLANVALGKMLDKTKHQTGKKLPYLRNINVRWGWVNTEDVLTMFFEQDEIERFKLEVGDILVCEGGEPGRAAVWNGHLQGMMYQKAIHRVRLFCNMQPRYIVFLLEFLAKAGRLDQWFTGSTIKHFTRESFVTLPVPLPPLAEQKRIVEEVERRLSVVEELESLVTTNLQRASRLRQAVLQKAFTGGLA